MTFLGSYTVVLLTVNAGLGDSSRLITIPVRLLMSLSCLIIIIHNLNRRSVSLFWFMLFVGIYLTRIAFDYITGAYFYISYIELLFYFMSFCVLPFLATSKVNLRKISFAKLYNVFLISAFAFSVLSVWMYSKYIGDVGRLSASRVDEDVVSPLILSYCSTLAIGGVSSYLAFNKTSIRVMLASLLVLILSLIPFFLGASRGSILALLVPLLFIMFRNISFKSIFKYSFYFVLIVSILLYLDTYLQSGLFNRFLGTAEAIETGGSSAGRLDIWKYSFSQFLDYPLLGDKLNTNVINHFPHNIYIEVLQTVGFIGFVPFLVLILKGLSVCSRIFKYHRAYSWLAVLFIQSMIRHTFSSALYTSVWFWTSLALILSLNVYLSKYETST